MAQGLNSAEMQRKNRTLVFQTLLEQGSMSRTRLAEQVGLQKPTITNIINEFLEMKIVRVDGEEASGRRSEKLAPVLDGIGILSLSLSRKDYQIGVYELGGTRVCGRRYRFAKGERLRDAFDAFKKEAREVMEEYGSDRILSISLAVPGPYIIDREHGGKAYFNVSGFEDLSEIDVQGEMEEALGSPVYMKHDAKLSAYAEWMHSDIARQDPNASMIVIRSRGFGIGAGLVINGRIVEGRTGTAGEIGHMGISYLQKSTAGTLEYRAGCESAVIYMKERLFEFPGSPLAEDSTYQDILDAYHAGDPLASWVMDKLAWMLGYGIANIVYVLNPDVIILGPDYPGDEAFLQQVRDAVRSLTQLPGAERVTIRYSDISDDSFLLGGFYYVREKLLREDRLIDRVREINKKREPVNPV